MGFLAKKPSVLIALILHCGIAVSVYGYEARIDRDPLGVPHIHGKRAVDAAFGLGYAQAEDSWGVIENTIPYYRGNAGKYFGPDAARRDFLVHWLNIPATVASQYDSALSPETIDYVEAFATGINQWATQHPDKVTLDILPITGRDIVAAHMLRHLLFYGFEETIKELLGDERARSISAGPINQGESLGSNAIAVAPSRTEDGSTYLMINSHQPLTGPVAWYEAHIQSDDGLNVMGGTFAGAPMIGVGFTADHGWGATVNKPDLADVYVLTINPENPDQYLLDGEWRDLQQTDIELDVLLFGFIPWSVTETVYRSAHGPVLKTDHGVYAVRAAGMGELRQVEQWLAMNRAKNFDEWLAAVQLNYISSFNFVYANKAGDIYFTHNSQQPKRVPGWDYSQYLPGDRSDLIWHEYEDWNNKPQLKNPESGFIVSTNQTPFMVTEEDSNLRREDFPTTAGYQTRVTNRTSRGLELFAQAGLIDDQKFAAIKHDKQYSTDYRGMTYLRAVTALKPADDDQAKAIDILSAWDLNTNMENEGAALGVCILELEWRNESSGTPLPSPEEGLATCIAQVLDFTGRLDPPWGEVQRHGRGETFYPIGGGPDTLRAMYAKKVEDRDFLTATSGDGLYYLIKWQADGTQTVKGVHQYGSNMYDPDSPHYLDQAEDFANEIEHAPYCERFGLGEAMTSVTVKN